MTDGGQKKETIMIKQGNCYLCGAECEMGTEIGTNVPWYDYECDYCGRYRISGTAQDVCDEDETKRHKAACVLAERRLKKMGKCRIHTVLFDDKSPSAIPTVTLDSMVDGYPVDTDLLDRSLLSLRRMVPNPGDVIRLDLSHPTVLFSRTQEDMVYILSQLRKADFIADLDFMPTGEHAQATDAMARGGFLIQAKGLTRIAELKKAPSGDKPQSVNEISLDEAVAALQSPEAQEPKPSPEKHKPQNMEEGAKDSTPSSESTLNYVDRFKTWAYSHKVVVAILVLVVALTAIAALLNQIFGVWKFLTH